jgi:hypothetical protein
VDKGSANRSERTDLWQTHVTHIRRANPVEFDSMPERSEKAQLSAECIGGNL